MKKVMVITGGSRGIGAACCRLFARAGAAVLVHYRSNGAAARAVVAELPPASHPHLLFGADLAVEAEVAALFAHASESWGGLDGLVNNAGVWTENPLPRLSLGGLRETLEVNVVGPFLCARAAVPLLRSSADGSIVNLTSTAGQRSEASYSPYAASKGAMISATKSWASELAPEIRVNSVAPGWVDTDMTAEALAGPEREKVVAGIPLRRVATADDIAGPVLFLASPLARDITGEILNVNGGSVLVG